MSTTWKAIPGFAGYEASADGEIRSYWTRRGLIAEVPHILKGGIAKGLGYRQYEVRRDDGVRKNIHGHRLVMLAFAGPCPDLHEVAHLDGVRDNNAVQNLRYVTRAENHHHMWAHGTIARAMSDADVVNVRERFAEGASGAALAREYGVSEATITAATRGDSYAHLPGPTGLRKIEGEMCGTAKLDTAKVVQMRELYAAGTHTTYQLAARFGINRTTAERAVLGKTWRSAGGPVAGGSLRRWGCAMPPSLGSE